MRAGDFERDGESGLLLPSHARRRGVLHERPQFMCGPAFFGGADASDPYFANVSLLLHFEGSNGSTTFTDSSANNYIPTVSSSVTISTAQKKFGAASGSFSGAGFLTYSATAPFNFGNASFTLEYWYYPIVAWGGSNNPYIFDGRTASTGPTAFAILFQTDGTLLLYAGNAHRFPTSGGAAPTVNAWNHIALCRDASTTTTRGFLNGMQIASWSGDTISYGLKPTIGNVYTGAASATSSNGYLDEFRITKGAARYTANFTPPTAAFPNS